MTNRKKAKPKPYVDLSDGPKKTSEDRARQFVQAYMSNGYNATHAAISAGYSKASATAKGCQLLHRPDVVALLDVERKRLADENKVTVDRITQELAKIAFGVERDPIKVKSLELLGKALGMFVEKVENKHTLLDADGNPTLPTVRVVFVNPSKETPSVPA